MRKIGLILDSTSGLTEAEANARGIGFIPLQVIINGKSHKAGVDITTEEVLNAMDGDKKNIDIKTSLPNGNDVEKAFEWALERYEKVLYIGVSGKMSGTINSVRNVMSLNEEYKNRITVYDSELSSPWLNVYIEDFEWLISEYSDIETITKILDLTKPYIIGHLSPEDIYWFYKGGRLSKMQYLAGSLLKVKPILTIEDGTLNKEKLTKARGLEKAMDKMIELEKEEIKIIEDEGIEYKIMTIDSSNSELTKTMIKKIVEEFNVKAEDVIAKPVSTEQSAHMGPAACGISVYISLKELIRVKGVK